MSKAIRNTLLTPLLVLLLMACSAAPADAPGNEALVQEPVATVAVEDAEPEQAPTLETEESMPDIDPFNEGLSGGMTEAFPFPATDDASGFDSMLGMYSYTTAFELERLVMLYQAALPTMGYALNTDTIIPGMAVISYEGDGEVLTLNITTNEDGSNKVNILVGVLQ